MHKLSKRENFYFRYGLFFISPWIVGFLVFTLYPILASIYYSLCYFDGISSPHFIGLGNYRELLLHDPLFRKSLYNTTYMIALGLPLSQAVALLLAFLLNQRLRGIAFYRTIFFLPSIVPIVATAILWRWLLNPEIGLINTLLAQVGINGPGWIASPTWMKPGLILMGIWGVGGSMIIYLAGLQDIPDYLYEAVEIDGGNLWHKIVYVALPMLSPIILFNLIIGLIGMFQYFTQAYVITNGLNGPQALDAALFYALYLFYSAFNDFRMGYACAMAWILFLITVVSTLLVFKSSARWVYYHGGEK